MEFKKTDIADINFFKSFLEEEQVILNADRRKDYAHDYTENLVYMPEIVLLPKNTEEVSEILKYCHSQLIPITPRGAGTGLSGGSLAIYGGICLSMEKFNKILEIDTQNMQAIVEPGVINQVFKQAVAEKGLYYPPDPASGGSCYLGGNVAHSSGGPRAVKYGTTKDYILNLEVVLPSGDIIWTGANTLKYSTGYHLTQLFVGSEGTLGVVTKIVTRLLPLPKHNLLMLAAFESSTDACKAVADIFMAGLIPSALEFMERDALIYTMEYTGQQIDLPNWVQAHLLIEVDGQNMDILYQDCETINGVLEKHGCREVKLAESESEKNTLWNLRRKVGEAVKAQSIYKEEDTVVPRAKLAELLLAVKKIGRRYGFHSVCYGHAGDGNLHVNILKGEMSDEAWQGGLKNGIREIFEKCKSLGGTISGEHGIGLVQKEYMGIIFPQIQLDLMSRIKQVFDPKGILNPGKIF